MCEGSPQLIFCTIPHVTFSGVIPIASFYPFHCCFYKNYIFFSWEKTLFLHQLCHCSRGMRFRGGRAFTGLGKGSTCSHKKGGKDISILGKANRWRHPDFKKLWPQVENKSGQCKTGGFLEEPLILGIISVGIWGFWHL